MVAICLKHMQAVMRRSAPPVLFVLAAVCALGQDFGGPSVLSRGGAAPGTRGGVPVNFTYYGGLSGVYTNSAVPLAQGEGVHKVSFYGGSLDFGLTGSHLWRHSMFGIDYRGNIRYDKSTHYTNGSEHALSMFYSTRPTRALQLMLAETATSSSYAFGNYTASAAATTDFIGVPLTDLFDSRVYSTQTTGTMNFRQSRFVSYQITADLFKIYRTNASLVGVNGSRIGGALRYAPTRRLGFNMGYDFSRFNFPRAYGDSNSHSIFAGFSYRPTRGWILQFSGGVYRVESVGVQNVTLVPEIADLLGVSTGIRSIYSRNWARQLMAMATYGYKRSNVRVGYNEGITPGNGVYLTSALQTATLGYSYSGLRKLSLSANANYDHYKSLFQQLQGYSSYSAGLSSNFVIRPHVNGTLSFDLRKYSISQGQSSVGKAVTLGIVLSPSRLPLPAW